jgi:hypothetical protein
MMNDLLFLFIGLIAGTLHGWLWIRTRTHNHRELKQNFLNLKQDYEELRKCYTKEKEKRKQSTKALNEFHLYLHQAREAIDQDDKVREHILQSKELNRIQKNLRRKLEKNESTFV